MTLSGPVADQSLWLRVLAALVLIPSAILAVYLDGWFLAVWVCAAGYAMAREWVRIVHREDAIGWRTWVHVAALTTSQIFLALHYQKWALVAVLFTALVASVLAQRHGERAVWAVSGILFVALPCVALVFLRQLPEFGFDTVIWLMCVVWATDSAAYLAGSAFGGPKLVPTISPKKTWAGAIAGLAAGVGATILLAEIVGASATMAFIGAGLCLSILTQCGDLAESFLKRRFGVKDASDLIPGHGGALDRLDGMIFATLGLATFVMAAGFSPVAWVSA